MDFDEQEGVGRNRPLAETSAATLNSLEEELSEWKLRLERSQ